MRFTNHIFIFIAVALCLMCFSDAAFSGGRSKCLAPLKADNDAQAVREQDLKAQDRRQFEDLKQLRRRVRMQGIGGILQPRSSWMTKAQMAEAIRDYKAMLQTLRFDDEHSGRDLNGYIEDLGLEFASQVQIIKKNGGAWMNLGSATFTAELEVARDKSKNSRLDITGFNHVELLSAKTKAAFAKIPGVSVKQIVGDFLGANMSEIPLQSLVTDEYGVATYSPFFDQVVEKAAAALKPGGLLIMKSNWNNTRIVDRDGYPICLERWFNQFRGLRLKPTTDDAYVLERTDEPLVVPSLRLIRFGNGSPYPIPQRIYFLDL